MIEHLEVDGVPVVFVRRSGPTKAGISFRVGYADETLAAAGVTHLVEHLALYGQMLTDHHSNGTTTAGHTHFFMSGDSSAVAGFLHGVCSALGRLPMQRLETEKGILRTEEAGRATGTAGLLAIQRYGAQGHGLAAYPEYGVAGLGEADVAGWSRHWFTRDNAVAWVSGEEVPRDLRLPLPPGRRWALPPAVSALGPTPAFYAHGSGHIAFDAVVRRSSAAAVFAGVLGREMTRRLRHEDGLSYTVSSGYEPRDRETAMVTAFADALPDKQDALVGGFVDVLATMRVGRIDLRDLDAVRARHDQALAGPDADADRLVRYATDLLDGSAVRTVDELRAELHAVTPADLHGVAAELTRTGLLQVPRGRTADWAGFGAVPAFSATRATGAWTSLHGDPEQGVIVGRDAVSISAPDGAVTVAYADCAAKLEWPDGARRLVGRDGFTVHIEPTLYGLRSEAIAAIDAAVDPRRVVRMPARDPGDIPQPPHVQRAAQRQAAKPGLGAQLTSRGTTVSMVALAVCAALLSIGASAQPFGSTAVIALLAWLMIVVYVVLRVVYGRRNAG
jgi:zinc protease